jgi:hypothetical protein
MKNEFEKTNFKLMNPFMFGTETPEGKLILRSEHDLMGVYRNKLFSTMTKKGVVNVSFVNEWLKDKTMRTYDRMDFLPCQQCPPNIDNTFKGFKAETKHLIKKI